MFAVTVTAIDPDDPLAGLTLGEHPDPRPAPGWTTVHVKAAALNHHDVWTLRGVGIDADRLPIVLGCDAAGTTSDGDEVVVHALVAADAHDDDETLDPRSSILSERHDGTFADQVSVPTRNLVPKPATMSFVEAACLPTAWLTAYRMLFTRAGLRPGDRVLVQGAGGGVSTAAILLARAAGIQVTVTSRDEAKLERAAALGANVTLMAGERLPSRVDAVIETVGEATWPHSIRALVNGGVIVVAGATAGPNPPADLRHVFYRQLRVVGSRLGTRAELSRLVAFLETTGVRPLVDDVMAMENARDGFERMLTGTLFGKLVFTRPG